MKALLFHCKDYEVKFDSFSNRPGDVAPEEVKEEEQECKDCVVAFITVEKKDDIEKFSSKLSDEILKMCEDVQKDQVVICPFAHLSNNLAKSKEGLEFFDLLEEKLKNKINLIRSHYGSHKSLLLDVYGHPGNVRFREF